MQIKEINKIKSRLNKLYDVAIKSIKEQVNNIEDLPGVNPMSSRCASISSTTLLSAPTWSTKYFLKDAQIEVVNNCIDAAGNDLSKIKIRLQRAYDNKFILYKDEKVRLNPNMLQAIESVLKELESLE